MDIQLANDIIKMMPQERTMFRYFQDRYAFMLLDYAIKDDVSIAALKCSRFAKLLDRPSVKSLLAHCGGGNICADELALAWPLETQNYTLTLGLWGSRKSKERDWHQTSRVGSNLVLQLNFDKGHDGAHERLLRDFNYSDFSCYSHPINKNGRTTLAWARLDIDLDGGEALIEELQNDWIRNAENEWNFVKKANWIKPSAKQQFERYLNAHLKPHIKSWSQAMLSAALFFLIEEIGIKKIWIHDFDTGNSLKKLTYDKPPRSLYTSLPKQFCFEKVNEAPNFLYQTMPRKIRKSFDKGNEAFWKMTL